MSDLRTQFAVMMRAAGVESLWQAAWAVSKERLDADYPNGGYCDEAIGHGAWDLLDEQGREDALDELFFAYAEMAAELEALKADREIHCGRRSPHEAHGGDSSYGCPGTPGGA